MPTYPLTSLLRLRRFDERRAEQALGEASAARARAEEEHERLLADARRARAAIDAQRAVGSLLGPMRAVEILARETFQTRLAGDLTAHAADCVAHERDVVRPARAAEADARTRWTTARARRDAVEKAIARRETVRRRNVQRRLEADADDVAARAPLRSPPFPR